MHLVDVTALSVTFFAKLHPANDPKIDPRAGLLPQFLIEDGGKEDAVLD